ncbi:MAG: hypothetical protein Q9226_001761 [Calogaya cf. arnoldii]
MDNLLKAWWEGGFHQDRRRKDHIFLMSKASRAFKAASRPLAQIAHGMRSGARKANARTDIVSPQLCDSDDALARLAPSLQKYKGCTIIDINPGIGLWSSKIHDIVKPRQHILAELPSSPFLAHLEPLVKQPSSRYKLVELPPLEAWESERYVADGLLPAFDTQHSTEPNQSILFLANTAYPSGRRRAYPRTHLKVLSWATDMASRINFHAGGPVRMLLWCPEKEATPILPPNLTLRTKMSLLLEMTCEIEEIVSADQSLAYKQKKRDQVLERFSGKRVAKLMEESGVSTPPGRETSVQAQIREAVGESNSEGAGSEENATSTRTRGWHQELEVLRQEFQDVPSSPKGKYMGLSKELLENPKFARFLALDRNLRHAQKRTGLVQDLVQEQAEIDALDLQAHDPNMEESQRITALAKLEQRKKQLRERLDNTKGKITRDEFEFFRDDKKAYSLNPPLLLWDRRSAEPLKAYKEEFYPEVNLCLLDIQPRHPIPYPMTGGQLMFLRMLMTTLWYKQKDNLTVLDRIAPGAFDAVTSKVPALTDPTRGGERDIRDLSIQRLTPEMAYGLTKAWFDWPLRPNLADLLHRGGLADDELEPDDAAFDDGAMPRH